MSRSLTFQVIVLVALAVVLGVLNNFRPSASIEWVRDWPPFSSLAVEEVEDQTATTENIAPAESATPEEASEDPQQRAAEVAALVTSNMGITDIELDQARAIHRYAGDFTLWIDARSPDLYEEGHIEGAELLHLYEKNEYLPQVEALIAETQPVVLVIYCKGRDCTDSHHLAQDLAAMGYDNIFVYRGGFQEWYQAGLPVAGALANQAPAADSTAAASTAAASTAAASTAADNQPTDAENPTIAALDPAEQASVMEQVVTNVGITDIDLETAVNFYRYAQDFTFWIDARSPDLYEKGHIKGATLLHIYEKNQYLPDVQAEIEAAMPDALVIYCKGKDCTDSHHLAQDLAAMGYGNIFVYTGGFQEWYQAGLPIEGTLAETAPPGETDSETVQTRAPLEELPPGMYLEHIVRDLVPFFFGLCLLISWRRATDSKTWLWTASIFCGAFFVYAAFPKLVNPFLFAKNIWNYDIAPGAVINLSALILPSLELVAGLALIFGLFRKGGGLIVSALLVIFIAAVSFNVLRGHEFNCGCTSDQPMFPNLYFEGWNDKYLLILRDLGLLAMSILAFKRSPPQPES